MKAGRLLRAEREKERKRESGRSDSFFYVCEEGWLTDCFLFCFDLWLYIYTYACACEFTFSSFRRSVSEEEMCAELMFASGRNAHRTPGVEGM